MGTVCHLGRGRKRRFLRATFRVSRLWRVMFFLLALCIVAALVLNVHLFPILSALAEAEATNLVTSIISRAVANQIAEAPASYSDLIHLRYRSDGSITALETNVSQINRTRSELVLAILDALDDTQVLTVGVPLGNIFGSDILSGRGPVIYIKLILSQKLVTSLDSSFSETGINQTIHRIFLTTSIGVTVLTPSRPSSVNISSSYCIAETVMLGEVPDAYTKINRLVDDISEEEIDYIYDFGAGQ